MKYLKKFENFDLGRFAQEQEEEENIAKLNLEEDEEDCAPCNDEEVDEIPGGEWEEEEEQEEEEEEEQEENRIRRWGDEVVEKKKVNAGFQAYLDKQKAKKEDKKDDKKEEKGGKKSKPDFLDLDKDGDKKESMKKAAKDAKDDKKEEKGGKGLTAGQKKLPEAMQKAILRKQK
jgi:hypothetical protein